MGDGGAGAGDEDWLNSLDCVGLDTEANGWEAAREEELHREQAHINEIRKDERSLAKSML